MARQSVLRHPWRVAIVVLALLAVLNLGILLAANSDTSEPGTSNLPSDIERVSPTPGSTVGLVTDVLADLAPGTTGGLQIDNVCIPLDQLDRDQSLGTVGFRPGSDKEFDEFDPGLYEVVVFYRESTDPEPDDTCDADVEGVSAYSWTFRVTS